MGKVEIKKGIIAFLVDEQYTKSASLLIKIVTLTLDILQTLTFIWVHA